MLKLVSSNDMNALAVQLAQSMQDDPLSPLAAETVIVQSNELSRWLSLFLAQRHGISSHIEFPYPSAFIWSLFRQLLPAIPKQSSFSTDAMTWRLFELLPICRQQAGFEQIDHYLGSANDPLKTYTLANHIADSFDQYLMYRADWIADWEAGRASHWQAQLWRLLVADDKKPMHRANLLLQLKTYLSAVTARSAGLPERISIFGLSALPPVYLELFELMAQHCEMTVYFLSPSEAYWGDLVDEKSKARRLSAAPEQANYLEIGHPLLASLGKQGQVFFEQLQACEPEPIDLFTAPEVSSLLGQLQYDIFALNNPDEQTKQQPVSIKDDSIQVHACHSAMREIEVLHDQLLALFERHPTLSPTDIVVMTPDMTHYTPWIDAVFGCAEAGQRIPYGIANDAAAPSQILAAFEQLLALPQSRFEVESVMSLLECEAIQHRFSLDEDKLEIIRGWLRETHTHWGYSAADKFALDLPENEGNTWRAGLDRLLLGYAMPLGEDISDWQLFEDRLGFDGISGQRAETMAQLCAFVDALDRFRQRLKRDFSVAHWQTQLLAMVDAFFKPSTEQPQEEAECLLIRKALDGLVETAELAAFEQTIGIDLVQEWLGSHLDASSGQTYFMGHGVTFCGMVPMRSIPFKVVCLIGMNDASYPRREARLGFDLMASTPARQGDRAKRDDDRYLFLESLLSARSHFYISYVGASISDNAAIPPSVLVSDVRDVLRQGAISEESEDIWQQILTQHPLQAFSRRYFDGSDGPLFSYAAVNCPLGDAKKRTLSTAWFDGDIALEDDHQHTSLAALQQFFRHPAKALLQQRLGLWFGEEDAQLESREPFALDGLTAWQLRQQLLQQYEAGQALADILPLVKASGALPQGQTGEQNFDQQADCVIDFADRLMAIQPTEFLEPISFDLSLSQMQLTGSLNQLAISGCFQYRLARTKGGELLAIWIQHLVLNLVKPSGVVCESRWLTEEGDYHFEAVDNAADLLTTLLDYYWQGLQQPLPLFSNTSFAFAKATLNGGKANPEKAKWGAWEGSLFVNGEQDDDYHAQLYDSPPLGAEFEALALAIYEPIHGHLRGGKL